MYIPVNTEIGDNPVIKEVQGIPINKKVVHIHVKKIGDIPVNKKNGIFLLINYHLSFNLLPIPRKRLDGVERQEWTDRQINRHSELETQQTKRLVEGKYHLSSVISS